MISEGRHTLTVRVHDEGDGFLWADVEELPGLFASGEGEDGLQAALEEALSQYFSTEGRRVVVRQTGVEHSWEQRAHFLIDA